MERTNELNQFNRKHMSPFSHRARKLLGRAFGAGVDPVEINGVMSLAIKDARLQGKGQITRGDLRSSFDALVERRLSLAKQPDSAPFDLRRFDFTMRTPEKSEMFTPEDAMVYIDGCDYPESVDDLLLALEVQRLFDPEGIRKMRIFDAMCGPGRLGRELLNLGAQHVMFHDGDETMITHARNKAFEVMQSGQSIGFIRSEVANIPLPDNKFDLIVSHNATHQLSTIGRLHTVMREFLRITTPGGHIVIADYQRATSPDFLKALEERLQCTRPEIVPLLIPSFMAAFSKAEFSNVLRSIPDIRNWSVTDAQPPILTKELQEVVEADPVKGHIMDYSPISLRVTVQKEQI